MAPFQPGNTYRAHTVSFLDERLATAVKIYQALRSCTYTSSRSSVPPVVAVAAGPVLSGSKGEPGSVLFLLAHEAAGPASKDFIPEDASFEGGDVGGAGTRGRG
jgi:hypothetical protein